MTVHITEVSICNQALSWLATGRITSLTENTDRARLCADNYYEARDATLEMAAWTFATKRFILNPVPDSDPVDPPYGYAKRYQLPVEILRVIECRSDAVRPNGVSNLDWRVEENYIVTDAGILYVKAIIEMTDVNLFSSLFRQAMTARLAAMMSPTITESNTKTETLWALFGNYILEATAMDSSQGKSDRIRGRSLVERVR